MALLAKEIEEMSSLQETVLPRTVIVTRHPGAVEWLADQGICGEVVTDLTPELGAGLRAGDLVVGPLPLHLVADLNRRGIQYAAIVMTLSPHRRGQQLSADEMTAAGACLRRFRVIEEESQ